MKILSIFCGVSNMSALIMQLKCQLAYHYIFITNNIFSLSRLNNATVTIPDVAEDNGIMNIIKIVLITA